MFSTKSTIYYVINTFLCFCPIYGQQLVSPCPRWFKYDPEGVVGDKWWGTISITTDTEYTGLWLRVTFDRSVEELGTDFGEAVQRETSEFLIRNSNYRLQAGEIKNIRIFARFKSGGPTPRLIGLRLNARDVCENNADSTNGDELISPCPKLFNYETTSRESDRWYGMINIKSDRDLQGVWLRIVLDRPSIQLGVSSENWFGKVTTEDNKEYLIKNREVSIQTNQIIPIRFFVKYNTAEPVPKLVSFRLNAVDVCPGSGGEVTGISDRDSVRPITQRPSFTTERIRPVYTTTEINKPNWIKPDTAPKPDTSIYGSDFDPHSRPGFLPGRHNTTSRSPCGTVVALPRPLITKGEAAGEAQFPWHAALYYNKGVDIQYICGASLISLKHVLTAAHCVTKRATNQPIAKNDVEVYLGKYNLRKFTSKEIQNLQVSQVIVHPEYNHRYYANDIAVLVLESSAEYTDYVRPVCLWSGNSDISEIVDREGTVVGWGYDETGKVTETLTKASMPVVPHAKCIWSYPEFFSKFSNAKSFCAGYRNGTSVCNGDSGGGLIFPKPDSNPNQPVWRIRGVVSISVALQAEFVCDTSHYTIFTDVAKYSDWIRDNLV